MNKKDQILTYYQNARELIKQNHPKAARSYILLILNEAVISLNNSKTIMEKVNMQLFLDKWINVSRELYSQGITNYVLECFGFPLKANITPDMLEEKPKKKSKPVNPESNLAKSNDDRIDISGLIDEAKTTQGWCAEVFETNKNAVVKIQASNSYANSNGTGFIISNKGYLLTNDHVVFDEENGQYFSKIIVSLFDSKKSFKAEVLFSDKKTDVALCRFDVDKLEECSYVQRINDYSKLQQGADCLIIGNAFCMGLAPFTGIVRFTKNSEGDLVYTAPSNPGDSGGPVFNRQGECIGINKSKTVAINNANAEGYANATPMDTIDALLEKWTKSNDIKL